MSVVVMLLKKLLASRRARVAQRVEDEERMLMERRKVEEALGAKLRERVAEVKKALFAMGFKSSGKDVMEQTHAYTFVVGPNSVVYKLYVYHSGGYDLEKVK